MDRESGSNLAGGTCWRGGRDGFLYVSSLASVERRQSPTNRLDGGLLHLHVTRDLS